MEKWREYFEELLGGVEERVLGRERRTEIEGEREEELGREEVRRVLKNIKEVKALGMDGIPGVVWKYGGEELERWLWSFYNRVWKGEGWKEESKEGKIVPIIKKGEGNRMEDYRGITIMTSAYKVYAAILAERLKEELEKGAIVPPNQAGFRKGVGTIDIHFKLFGQQTIRDKEKISSVRGPEGSI